MALVGVAGGLAPELRTGDLVVASELRESGSTRVQALPAAPLVAAAFRRAGLGVRLGPLVSSPRYVRGRERADLAASGAVAVDMESAWVMGSLVDHPLAVVRAISDTTDRGPVLGGARALGSLLAVRAVLERWARACGERDVILASPRSFCAGVERAIETVERALERYGAPVYVRRQIVHNLHVVRDLESKGAVFVEEIADVPPHAVVVLAAHGVSPAVRRQAGERGDLKVIDATCPLVAKVHSEARRYANHDYNLVLVGHADHEEIVGTLGEAPDRFHLVEDVGDVAGLELEPGRPVAYLTQTTLATDETAEIISASPRPVPRPRRAALPTTSATPPRTARTRCGSSPTGAICSSWSARRIRRIPPASSKWRGGRAAGPSSSRTPRSSNWAGSQRQAPSASRPAPRRPTCWCKKCSTPSRSLGPVRLSEERSTEETVRFALPTQVR